MFKHVEATCRRTAATSRSIALPPGPARARLGWQVLRSGHRRVSLRRPVVRSAAARTWICRVALPPEDGPYRVQVAPVEDRDRFILIDGAHGRRSSSRWMPPRVASAAALRRAQVRAGDSQGLCLSVAEPVEQPQADPLHGAARHSGALPRQLRRRAVDLSESAAADGDLFLRLRRGAANQVRRGYQPHRLRALLSGRDAAVAARFPKPWADRRTW